MNAGYRLFAWGTQPIGALLGGIVGELLGLPGRLPSGRRAALSLLLGFRIVTDRAMSDAENASSEVPVAS